MSRRILEIKQIEEEEARSADFCDVRTSGMMRWKSFKSSFVVSFVCILLYNKGLLPSPITVSIGTLGEACIILFFPDILYIFKLFVSLFLWDGFKQWRN